MYYPPCPPYYPTASNDWNTLIPRQCPVYGVQPTPIIGNLLVSPFTPTATLPAVTMADGFLPAVLETNEYKNQIFNSSKNTPHELLPVYRDMSPVIGPNGYLYFKAANKVAQSETPLSDYSSFATHLSNETFATTSVSQEYTALVPNEFPSIDKPMSDYFSHNQTPSKFAARNKVLPTSLGNYSSHSHFKSDVPKTIQKDRNRAKYEESRHMTESPLDYYLSLPKELFPTVRMLTIDPNSMIDEFCKVSNIDDHSWILDLEFGVPRSAVTRRVAIYNVKFNRIHCKNSPDAIHPGFEMCDKGLKRALMFYYDCVISNWYRGYMELIPDGSVESFQSWLLLPMQVLGMCWR